MTWWWHGWSTIHGPTVQVQFSLWSTNLCIFNLATSEIILWIHAKIILFNKTIRKPTKHSKYIKCLARNESTRKLFERQLISQQRKCICIVLKKITLSTHYVNKEKTLRKTSVFISELFRPCLIGNVMRSNGRNSFF